jgi:hypothetical protein
MYICIAPYQVIRAGSLELELGEGFSCVYTLCVEKANLIHYCIERYLALALLYLGAVAVVLPWYCPLSTPHSLGEHSLGGWYVVRASVLVSA